MQIGSRAGESIQPRNDQRVSFAGVVQRLGKRFTTLRTRPAPLLREQLVTSCSLELLKLDIQRLAKGTDAGVTDGLHEKAPVSCGSRHERLAVSELPRQPL